MLREINRLRGPLRHHEDTGYHDGEYVPLSPPLLCTNRTVLMHHTSGGMEVRFTKPEGHVWGEEAAGAWGRGGGAVVDEMVGDVVGVVEEGKSGLRYEGGVWKAIQGCVFGTLDVHGLPSRCEAGT